MYVLVVTIPHALGREPGPWWSSASASTSRSCRSCVTFTKRSTASTTALGVLTKRFQVLTADLVPHLWPGDLGLHLCPRASLPSPHSPLDALYAFKTQVHIKWEKGICSNDTVKKETGKSEWNKGRVYPPYPVGCGWPPCPCGWQPHGPCSPPSLLSSPCFPCSPCCLTDPPSPAVSSSLPSPMRSKNMGSIHQ